MLWHILLKNCFRISKNIKFSCCSQALLIQGTIISLLENIEKKKCSLPYLVVVILNNSLNYSVLKFCRKQKLILIMVWTFDITFNGMFML